MVIDKVNYLHSLEFAIRASAMTTTFQQSIEMIRPLSVPNWRRRSEEDPGLPITSISGDSQYLCCNCNNKTSFVTPYSIIFEVRLLKLSNTHYYHIVHVHEDLWILLV